MIYKKNLRACSFSKEHISGTSIAYRPLEYDTTDYSTSIPVKAELPANEVLTIEGAFVMDDFFFVPTNSEYGFLFQFRTYDDQNNFLEYTFEFPVKIVKLVS